MTFLDYTRALATPPYLFSPSAKFNCPCLLLFYPLLFSRQSFYLSIIFEIAEGRVSLFLPASERILQDCWIVIELIVEHELISETPSSVSVRTRQTKFQLHAYGIVKMNIRLLNLQTVARTGNVSVG